MGERVAHTTPEAFNSASLSKCVTTRAYIVVLFIHWKRAVVVGID